MAMQQMPSGRGEEQGSEDDVASSRGSAGSHLGAWWRLRGTRPASTIGEQRHVLWIIAVSGGEGYRPRAGRKEAWSSIAGFGVPGRPATVLGGVDWAKGLCRVSTRARWAVDNSCGPSSGIVPGVVADKWRQGCTTHPCPSRTLQTSQRKSTSLRQVLTRTKHHFVRTRDHRWLAVLALQAGCLGSRSKRPDPDKP